MVFVPSSLLLISAEILLGGRLKSTGFELLEILISLGGSLGITLARLAFTSPEVSLALFAILIYFCELATLDGVTLLTCLSSMFELNDGPFPFTMGERWLGLAGRAGRAGPGLARPPPTFLACGERVREVRLGLEAVRGAGVYPGRLGELAPARPDPRGELTRGPPTFLTGEPAARAC